jgi:hypothetical protein
MLDHKVYTFAIILAINCLLSQSVDVLIDNKDGLILKKSYKEPENFVVSVFTNGSYFMRVKNQTWLASSQTKLRANRFDYSNYDKSLILTKTTARSGSDILGQWQSVDFIYQLYDDSNTTMICSIITYLNNDLVRFIQVNMRKMLYKFNSNVKYINLLIDISEWRTANFSPEHL